MKKYFFFFAFFFIATISFSQTNGRHRVAVFAPLYLDSAFNNGNYTFYKTFPKFLNPGVEFIQGVQVALDSLQKRGAPLEVFIYDIKSKSATLTDILKGHELDSVEMMIGHANSPETKMLADEALKRKIPFVSATLPNDAGINSNPYLVLLNTTLQGHLEGMYKMLQRSYASDRIIVLRKNGTQEDAIKSHLTEVAKMTPAPQLNIKFVEVGAAFTTQSLSSNMDSTKRTVFIAGSMDEVFGMRLATALASYTKYYPMVLLGMPTWDNANFNKSEFKGLDILYSTPFYYNRLTPLESRMATEFEKTVSARPTDMYFRGYETMMRFALLLLDTKKDIASNLTRKGNAIFTRFDVQPVFKNKNNMTLDYFENKNLYFVRVTGGTKRLM